MMRILPLLLLLPFALMADEQEKNREWQQTPFGERGVYQLDTQFSFISAWGLTDRHDIVSTTNGGAVSLVNGFLEVNTSTTADSTAQLTTTERVIYESGRQIEAAIKVSFVDPPEDGALAEWGMKSADNGAYFRLQDGELSAVYEARGVEDVTPRSEMRGNAASCDGFNPVTDAAVYTVRFNWYGAGGASYWAYYADDQATDTLTECLLHHEAPDTPDDAWDNPNLPLTAYVDNTASPSNDQIIMDVGGRRAGSQGSFTIDERFSGDFRTNQSVAAADGLVPLVCVRKETDFPEAGATNSVPVRVDFFSIDTNNPAVVYLILNPSISGGSFGNPTFHNDSETSIETNTGATSVTNGDQASGPFLMAGGAQANQTQLGQRKVDVTLIRNQPLCLVADVAADSTITSALRLLEGW